VWMKKRGAGARATIERGPSVGPREMHIGGSY
jgi:hypothetical protein